MKLSRFLTIVWIIFSITLASGQSEKQNSLQKQTAFHDSLSSNLNRLTVYVIHPKKKYDWTSPRTLYKSYFKNASRTLLNKSDYALGHTFLDLQPSAKGERIFTGMRAACHKEQKELIFRQHYGLAILGCEMEGRLETEEELKQTLDKFLRKGRIAFIEFLISDSATQRLTEYFHAFKARSDPGSAGPQYGGAFWPRYYGEGAGCSAFVISFLDLAGLLKDDFDEWLVKIDIPMTLIGGPYNNFNEVRLKEIRQEKSWTYEEGTTGTGYAHLELYDPTLMFEWINEIVDNNGIHGGYYLTPVQMKKANGILIDSRNQPLPVIDSLFMNRDKPSLFINPQ